MTLLLDGPRDVLGWQEPRLSYVPESASSAGKEAVELAESAGLILDPWQQYVLEHSLGERRDGKWAAPEVGLCVPRQNGKGSILAARELAGLFLFDEELIIHSAHEQATASGQFQRLLDLIDGVPEFTRRMLRPLRGKGAEVIRLRATAGHKHQDITFKTRTGGGGRGMTCDCLILDEAMILPDAFVSAVGPTQAARSLLTETGVQTWYTGSAVDQQTMDHGVVFARVRERGMEGGRPLAYFEWSVDCPDPSKATPELLADRAAWAQANPGLGIRIAHEYVERELDGLLSLRGFIVERMGIGDWPLTDGMGVRVIGKEAWFALVDLESKPENPVCLAFDVTPDRATSTIAAAGFRKDGLAHVEVIQQDRGTEWVPARLAELKKAHKPIAIVYDASGPAGSLVSELAKLHLNVLPVTSKEHAQACGMFYDAVTDSKTIRHLGTPELNDALAGAAKRPLGDAWAWSRTKSSLVDISPLVACTLAYWGCKTRKHGSLVVNPYDLLVQAGADDAEQVDQPAALEQPPRAEGSGPFTRSRWTVS